MGITRNKCIAYQQRQVGTALTILDKIMSLVLKNLLDKITMLKSLGEATSWCVNSIIKKLKTRRSVVALDKHFIEITHNTIFKWWQFIKDLR